MRQLLQRVMGKLAYRRPTSFGRGTLFINGHETTKYATVVYDPVRRALDISVEPFARMPTLSTPTPTPTGGVTLPLS